MGNVNINITKQIYEYIEPSTGEKITPEEFAKRHPSVVVGGHRPGDATEAIQG